MAILPQQAAERVRVAVGRPHLHLLHFQLLHLLEQCLSLEFILQLPSLLFCFYPF